MKIKVGTYEDEVRSPVVWDAQINGPEEAYVFQQMVQRALGQVEDIAKVTGYSVEGIEAVLGCFRDVAASTIKIVEEKLAAMALLPPEAPVQEPTNEDQV